MSEPKKPTNGVVRWLDAPVVGLIKLLMALAHIRSRDPRKHSANLLRADPEQLRRIRNWEGILDWSPEKRVGCSVAVLIGIALGGAILWYNLN